MSPLITLVQGGRDLLYRGQHDSPKRSFSQPLFECSYLFFTTGDADNDHISSAMPPFITSNTLFSPEVIQIPVESKLLLSERDEQTDGERETSWLPSQQSRLILLKCLIALTAETFYRRCILLPRLQCKSVPPKEKKDEEWRKISFEEAQGSLSVYRGCKA